MACSLLAVTDDLGETPMQLSPSLVRHGAVDGGREQRVREPDPPSGRVEHARLFGLDEARARVPLYSQGQSDVSGGGA